MYPLDRLGLQNFLSSGQVNILAHLKTWPTPKPAPPSQWRSCDVYDVTFQRTRHRPSEKSWLRILKVPISEVLETCAPMQAQAS